MDERRGMVGTEIRKNEYDGYSEAKYGAIFITNSIL
jgi:hypothetical protein